MRNLSKVRLLLAISVIVLLSPLIFQASAAAGELDTSGTDFGRSDILFVTTQGTSTFGGISAQAVAIDTRSGDVVWRHSDYRRYFDIDPLDNETVLFLGAEGRAGSRMYVNIVNWRTDEMIDRFRVPRDTHDVDQIGDGQFAIADKANDRLYILDRESNRLVWEYRFSNHFPPPPEAGGGGGGYTHVNDVDMAANGSKVLASPRNFDRVILINISDKRLEWTLGRQNDYSILHRQHNPVLLSEEPPTVLVADSENNRIVEYRWSNDSWEIVWSYRGDLLWPRDADRLPNGNTLVVDSLGQRVLELTPSRQVLWEVTVGKQPYDAELLSLGDEPSGPSMIEYRDQFSAAEPRSRGNTGPQSLVTKFMATIQWVFPWTITLTEWVRYSLGGIVLVLWIGAETNYRINLHQIDFGLRRLSTVALVITPVQVVFGIGLWLVSSGSGEGTIMEAVGILMLGHGILSVRRDQIARIDMKSRLGVWFDIIRLGVGAILVGIMFWQMVRGNAVAFHLGISLIIAMVSWNLMRELIHTGDPWIANALDMTYFAVRMGAFAPALTLVVIGGVSHFTVTYVWLSAIIVGTAAMPSDQWRSPISGRQMWRFLSGGLRTVSLIFLFGTGIALVFWIFQFAPRTVMYSGMLLVVLHVGIRISHPRDDQAGLNGDFVHEWYGD